MKTQSAIMEDIAREAHKNQFRYDGKTSYVVHLERVVARVKNRIKQRAFDDDEEIIISGFGEDNIIAAAWGHDLLEDTQISLHDLKTAGIHNKITDVIYILTHEKDEDYFHYIDRVDQIFFSRLIKIADILDNLSDTPTKTQVAKYARALNILLGYE